MKYGHNLRRLHKYNSQGCSLVAHMNNKIDLKSFMYIHDESVLVCLNMHQLCFAKCQSLDFSEFPKNWHIFA